VDPGEDVKSKVLYAIKRLVMSDRAQRHYIGAVTGSSWAEKLLVNPT